MCKTFAAAAAADDDGDYDDDAFHISACPRGKNCWWKEEHNSLTACMETSHEVKNSESPALYSSMVGPIATGDRMGRRRHILTTVWHLDTGVAIRERLGHMPSLRV